jgi:hypothetical protein
MHIPKPRWAVVGKVCSPRKLVIGAFERAMEKAWGLHRQAQFKDLGDNRFIVRFSSEGDWYQALHNGPWQFDFNIVLLKNYNGSVRPSDIVFDTMDIWIRVLDLPMDMMNRVYGEIIGAWVGKFIRVEVDEEGLAWGKDLRIRVALQVDQPLVRGVPLKEKDDDAECRWFDIKYEKIPHFCFECGRLVHPEEGCTMENMEVAQWGEWLRASPRKGQKPPRQERPSVSSSSHSGGNFSSDLRRSGAITVRDICDAPPFTKGRTPVYCAIPWISR